MEIILIVKWEALIDTLVSAFFIGETVFVSFLSKLYEVFRKNKKLIDKVFYICYYKQVVYEKPQIMSEIEDYF